MYEAFFKECNIATSNVESLKYDYNAIPIARPKSRTKFFIMRQSDYDYEADIKVGKKSTKELILKIRKW